MDVLLMESHPGLGAAAARELERGGHTVVRCLADDGGVLCAGLVEGGGCPLDHHEVSVALLARIGDEFRPGEHGALCAARHRIPVVTTCQGEPGVLDGIATHAEGDLVAAVESAAGSGTQHAAAVVRALLRSGVIGRDDTSGDDPALTVAVERSPRRLAMTLWIKQGDPREPSIVKAATEALRRHDPHTAVIDVSVRH